VGWATNGAMRRRSRAWPWIIPLLALAASGCLVQKIRTESKLEPVGEALGPALRSTLFPLVLLHRRDGVTDLGVALLGRCGVYDLAEEQRTQIREKRVSDLTVAVTAITIMGAFFIYTAPDEGPEQDQTPSVALLGIAALAYGIPAIQEDTVATSLSPRQVYRLRERVPCLVRPMGSARVEAHGAGPELMHGETDEHGQLTFDRALPEDVVIIVDGRKAEIMWWPP